MALKLKGRLADNRLPLVRSWLTPTAMGYRTRSKRVRAHLWTPVTQGLIRWRRIRTGTARAMSRKWLLEPIQTPAAVFPQGICHRSSISSPPTWLSDRLIPGRTLAAFLALSYLRQTAYQ